VAAFQSTLTEAREATLLLHVVDVSDPRRDEHIDEVNRVLAEIGAADLPQILVFNKIDRIDTPPRVERDESGSVSHVWLSAPMARARPAARVGAERLARVARRATLRLPVSAGELAARLYAANLVRPSGSPTTAPSKSTLNCPSSSCSNGRASPASKF
jgi:GTP-binding protein HflX